MIRKSLEALDGGHGGEDDVCSYGASGTEFIGYR